MKPFKLPKMNESEIRGIIEKQNICRIAFMDDEFPYIAPFQYVTLDNNLYFHLTDYGKKKEIILRNPNICVAIEDFAADLSEYRFVSIQGKLEIVKDEVERANVIQKFAANAKKRFSTVFLSAHGLDKSQGWSALNTDMPLLIFKLKQIGFPVALKSP